MLSSLSFLFDSFNLTLGKVVIPVRYWQAAGIVFLLFILVLTLARFRRHYVDWSLKGGVVGIFFGFLLALILEGFFIIGGKTALTELIGWKSAPKPVARVLDAGREKLINVLGINTEIPTSFAKESSSIQEAVDTIQSLNPEDLGKVKKIICAP